MEEDEILNKFVGKKIISVVKKDREVEVTFDNASVIICSSEAFSNLSKAAGYTLDSFVLSEETISLSFKREDRYLIYNWTRGGGLND